MAIDLIQHFVPATGVAVTGDVQKSRMAVTSNQRFDTLKLLAHRIFASGKQVNRQIGADVSKTDRVRQAERCAEKGCERCGLKLGKAQRVIHKCVYN